MLTVTFISRCSGDALNRTRRVLDAYAQRVGETTWFASITTEGMESAHAALRRVASRRTAVSCHRMTRKGADLLWIVGRRRAFSEHGTAPLRTSKNGHSALKRRVPFNGLPRLIALSEYAGLRHDIGKGTRLFLSKITQNQKISDPVRHEWLSVHVNRSLAKGKTFQEALAHAADQALAHAPDSGFLPLPTTECQVGEWIIATHHRLPDEEGLRPVCRQHIHVDKDAKQHKEQCKKLRKPPSKADLFADPAVAKARSDHALESTSLSDPMKEALFLWGRLAMMLSDHHVSSLPDRLDGVSGLQANAKQDLGAHLLAVGSKARHAARLLSHLESKFPAVYPEERRTIDISASKKFAWQNAAARAAKDLASKDDAHLCGTFVVLCASTGSGKTRAGARIASSLAGPRLRLSTLLGLRTLTLQTGASYRRELGLLSSQVATLIGSKEIRALHEASARDNKDAPESDDDLDLQAIIESESASEIEDGLPPLLESQIRRRDDRQLLSAPVLVSTIDYLIKGGDWRRSWHIVPQLRLLTSDVLLDEIDGYSLEDYPAIGRLCYLVGLFGRRLILSSATAMPEMVAPLYHAYADGRRAYAALTGAKPTVQTLFVADHAAPESGRHHDHESVEAFGESVKAFGESYTAYAGRVGTQALKAKTLRRGRAESIEDLAGLMEAVKTLHASNAVRSEDGSCVSIGLIRFAHVRDAVQIACAIAERADDFERAGHKVVVIPYHARMLLAVRAYTEQRLDQWLNRKFNAEKGERDPILSADPVMPALRAGHRSVILIVVATPVEEVGRDHDFDWAIIEPSSSRSIAQCAGRVNRHRREEIPEGRVNVVVMRRNLRRLAGLKNTEAGRKNTKAVFGAPGFENERRPFENFPEAQGLDVYDVSVTASSLIARPDAAACLLPRKALGDRGDWLAFFERKEIQKQMEDSLVGSFLQKIWRKFTTHHFKTFPFRNGEASVDVYFNPVTERWHKAPEGQQKEGVRQAFKNVDAQERPGIWLQPEDFAQVIQVIADQSGYATDQPEFYTRYLTVSLRMSDLESKDSLLADPLIGIYRKAPVSVLIDPSVKGL